MGQAIIVCDLNLRWGGSRAAPGWMLDCEMWIVVRMCERIAGECRRGGPTWPPRSPGSLWTPPSRSAHARGGGPSLESGISALSNTDQSGCRTGALAAFATREIGLGVAMLTVRTVQFPHLRRHQGRVSAVGQRDSGPARGASARPVRHRYRPGRDGRRAPLLLLGLATCGAVSHARLAGS